NPHSTRAAGQSVRQSTLKRQGLRPRLGLDARTSSPNRGLKPCRFSVLCRTDCPAALVECGFVSSKSERRLLCSPAYQQRVALAIAEGIAIGVK
ncbi:MAG: N-acetylmuramoyl-L-alanine amidase, partial [Verrucomicrobiaceae bacterium]